MGKFAMGGAMGFMLGAGLMMMPAGMQLRRDVLRKKKTMQRWARNAGIQFP